MSGDQPLDCRAAAHLMSAALEDAVTPADRGRLQRHFIVCHACRNVDAQLAFLRAAMHRLADVDSGAADDIPR